mgnify:CR=1 FL=1
MLFTHTSIDDKWPFLNIYQYKHFIKDYDNLLYPLVYSREYLWLSFLQFFFIKGKKTEWYPHHVKLYIHRDLYINLYQLWWSFSMLQVQADQSLTSTPISNRCLECCSSTCCTKAAGCYCSSSSLFHKFGFL